MLGQGKLASTVSGLLILGLLFTHASCAHRPDPNVKPDHRVESSQQPVDYAEVIHQQDQLARSQPDPVKRATAYEQLARLYCGYDNPARDYRRALASLRQAVSLDSNLANRYEVRNLMALLTEIQGLSDSNMARQKEIETVKRELKQINRKCESTANDLAACRSDNIRFIQENVELKTSIERLKSLDIEIETKRKQYK